MLSNGSIIWNVKKLCCHLYAVNEEQKFTNLNVSWIKYPKINIGLSAVLEMAIRWGSKMRSGREMISVVIGLVIIILPGALGAHFVGLPTWGWVHAVFMLLSYPLHVVYCLGHSRCSVSVKLNWICMIVSHHRRSIHSLSHYNKRFSYILFRRYCFHAVNLYKAW